MSEERPVVVRELLYYWDSGNLNVLVPKKRGEGFLAVPLGHHHDPFFSHLETKLESDICGLDGYLAIDCGSKIATYPEKRKQFEALALPTLESKYGCKAREIWSTEFFAILGL